MAEKVYLVDGSAYIYRAYHAVAPLTNSSGLPTHAVYGFVNILLRVIREKAPRYLAVAFDLKGPTFRHEIYSEYKANRPPMPEDLACQIPYVRDIVKAYNIACLEREGFEADDLIASAVMALEKKGLDVVVVSGDKDLLQLVSDRTTVWEPMKDRVMGPQEVAGKYGVPVASLLDYFALVGDSSDNIPGVPGIGPKTAEKLISDFGTLDSLYENLAGIDKRNLADKLAANRDGAFLSRDLIRLKDDLEVPAEPDAYLLPEPDNDRLRELFTFLGFSRLLKSQVENPALDKKGYCLVENGDALKKLVARLGKAPALVVDTETSGLDTLTAELVGISLCADEKEAFYIPVGHRREDGSRCPGQMETDQALEILRPLLEDQHLPKICHNLKFDHGILVNHGVTMAGPLYDTMIASYLIDPSRRSNKLDDLCAEILKVKMTPFSEVVGLDKKSGKKDAEVNFAFVEIKAAKDYSCEDVHGTYLLWRHFRPQLEDLDLWDLFASIEMPLVLILSAMERTGILVSQEELKKLAGEFGRLLEDLERDIYRLAGETFNINSPKQLGEILFEKLNLPHGKKTKTGYSTDASVLEKLANFHDLPAAVVNYRNLAKLKSTYADRLLELVHPRTGRVHTSYNQTVTTTGRLSSSEPNLQNIPIRTPEGQRIRQTFIPEKGRLLLGADYSQIELRVLAHYSGDHALRDAFLTGQDIHSQTAAEVFQVSPPFVTSQMRRVAKTINFGIVYGISAFGLASQLHISRKEAATFIERYFAHYAGVKKYMEDVVVQAREDGYVTTLFKRRRPLPDIKSANKNIREFAERTAINTPIQGTAADIIKLATIEVDRRLKTANLPARLLLQIHDELVLEVVQGEVAGVAAVVKEAMESVVKLAVPLVVNVSSGNNLAET